MYASEFVVKREGVKIKTVNLSSKKWRNGGSRVQFRFSSKFLLANLQEFKTVINSFLSEKNTYRPIRSVYLQGPFFICSEFVVISLVKPAAEGP